MLNYYWWYFIIWGIVLALYACGWSSINTILSQDIIAFFVLTIFASLMLGTISHGKFRMRYLCEYKKKNDIYITALLILYFIFEFYRFGGVPMLNYFGNKTIYASAEGFKGIKTLYALVMTFSVFYSIYLFFIYMSVNRQKIRFLIEGIALSFTIFIAGHRGTFVTNVFAMTMIYLSYTRLSVKRFLIYVCYLMLLLYFFGIVGNMRSGSAWNDDTLITFVGGFSETWPSYIPNAYKWAYSYITSPLNNLNYNYINNINYNWLKCIEAFFPDFLVKRLVDGYSISGDVKLIVASLNVSTGFIKVCINGGIVGMFFMYIGLFLILGAILSLIKIGAPSLFVPSLALANNIVCFFFFENTIAHSGFMLPLLYPLLCAILNIFLSVKHPCVRCGQLSVICIIKR